MTNMVTYMNFESEVKDKLTELLKYYMEKLDLSSNGAYAFLDKTGIIRYLENPNMKLYTKPLSIMINAVDMYYFGGQKYMLDYLSRELDIIFV